MRCYAQHASNRRLIILRHHGPIASLEGKRIQHKSYDILLYLSECATIKEETDVDGQLTYVPRCILLTSISKGHLQLYKHGESAFQADMPDIVTYLASGPTGSDKELWSIFENLVSPDQLRSLLGNWTRNHRSNVVVLRIGRCFMTKSELRSTINYSWLSTQKKGLKCQW